MGEFDFSWLLLWLYLTALSFSSFLLMNISVCATCFHKSPPIGLMVSETKSFRVLQKPGSEKQLQFLAMSVKQQLITPPCWVLHMVFILLPWPVGTELPAHWPCQLFLCLGALL